MSRSLDQDDSEEAEVARDYLAAERSVLLEDSNPPLDLPAFKSMRHQKSYRHRLKAA